MPTSHQLISFGEFRLDRRTRRLRHRGSERPLRPKSSAVLLYLAERPNRLVPREEILGNVWSDATVSPTVLRVCIREIRLALADDADRFLETVPRRGYRFRIESGDEGAAPSTFVGRASEMAVLHEAFARARGGRFEVVFVTGDAGAGKTALVEHFLDEVRADGGAVCGRGRSIELQGPADGSAAVLELLSGLCDEADGERVVEVLEEHAPGWLRRLPRRGGRAGRSSRRRQRDLDWEAQLLELRQALEVLSSETPLVLLLEDLQWSDPQTMDALAHVTQADSSVPILLIGTYESDAVPEGHALLGLREQLEVRRRCNEIVLGGLSVDEVAAYLGARLASPDDGIARPIHEYCGGHPLDLVALVDGLLDQNRLLLQEGVWQLGGSLEEVAADLVPRRAAPGEAGPYSPFEAERRQLTVLCCELTSPSDLDLEDVRSIVRASLDSAVGVVQHYDGHIAQYLASGLVVYFGYPNAHEDDAARAVRAGLELAFALDQQGRELERRYGGRVASRIGIHTGPVVIDEVGEAGNRQVLALGSTANVAARLQDEARPGVVLMTGQTHRLVRGIFVTHDLGVQTLAGLTEPVEVIEVERATGVRSRVDVVPESDLTPFVGRDEELDRLEARFAQVREGAGQTILVSGDAGMGKSRLLHAFRRQLVDRPHSWLECHCSPYDQGSPFHPVIELLRQVTGISEENPAEVQIASLERELEAHDLPPDPNLPLLTELLALPAPAGVPPLVLAPEGRRLKLRELLVAWVRRMARSEPLVLVVEDLHWIDPSTRDWLGALIDGIADVPVLLALNFRPDFEPPWPQKIHTTAVSLSRLDEAQTAELVERSRKGAGLPKAWREEIVRRSDGVPFFAEELTRTVVETTPEIQAEADAPTLAIPETLQDSLTAHLDALGSVKELAQIAAVLGREFEYEMLCQVSPRRDEAVDRALEEGMREQVFHRGGGPRGETYHFKHALIRDAAYQSMLRSQRRSIHLRVAEAMLAGDGKSTEQQPERVAHHLAEGGDAARAIPFFQAAGGLALRNAALFEAEAHLQRAIGLLPYADLGDRAIELDLYEALASVSLATQGYGAVAFGPIADQLEELVEACPEHPRVPWAYLMLVNHHREVGRHDRAVAFAGRAVQSSEQQRDEDALAYNQLTRGHLLGIRGRFDEALAIIDEFGAFDAETERRRLQRSSTSATLNTGFAWAALFKFAAGRPIEALETANAGVAHLDEIRAPLTECLVLLNASAVHLIAGKFGRAIELAEQLMEIAGENGLAMWRMMGWATRATAHALTGNLEGAEWTAVFGDVPTATIGVAAAAPFGIWLGALTERARGNADLALRWAHGTAAVLAPGASWWNVEFLRLKAEILAIEKADPAGAEAAFDAALDLARAQGARTLELRAATSYGRHLRDVGRGQEVRGLIEPLYEWFGEGHDLEDLVAAKSLLDESAS